MAWGYLFGTIDYSYTTGHFQWSLDMQITARFQSQAAMRFVHGLVRQAVVRLFAHMDSQGRHT